MLDTGLPLLIHHTFEPAHDSWYLSHRRPAKAQASLCICAVSPEPSVFASIKYGNRRRIWPNFRHVACRWLRMRVWKIKLQRMKSTIISWAGSFIVFQYEPHHEKTCFSPLPTVMRKPVFALCQQQWRRSAWASAQSDQSLPCPHEESLGP